jgi:hypothetical protein
MADEPYAVLEQSGHDGPYILVGHSMGGDRALVSRGVSERRSGVGRFLTERVLAEADSRGFATCTRDRSRLRVEPEDLLVTRSAIADQKSFDGADSRANNAKPLAGTQFSIAAA